MPSKNLQQSPNVSTYAALLTRVRAALIEGQRRIEAERVRIYWETGRLVESHILKHADRAEYGAQVISRLSKDLNVNKTVLTRCVQFAKKYPHPPIVARGQQFSWSHYRKLITIDDDKKRSLLEQSIGRHAWSAVELAAHIKTQQPADPSTSSEKTQSPKSLLTPLRGELYTYRLVERPTLGAGEDSGLLIDLGFGIFRDVEPRTAAAFSKGDIVQTYPKEDAYRFSKTDRTAKDLFTYRAYVEKVIDGDTLKVRLDLGFNTWIRQTLRLRDLDCPELDTKSGQEAKAFVSAQLKAAPFLIVRSSRSDKYDRYLADVFIPTGEEPDAGTDLYLNNLLLEQGWARKVNER